jgi:hypothetical protein
MKCNHNAVFNFCRRISAVKCILLALIIFYSSAGFYVVFIFQQLQLNSFVQQIIQQDKTVKKVLFISVDEEALIHWQGKKEFMYHDALYDLISLRKSEKGITVICFHDTSEQQLISGLIKHINDHLKDIPSAKFEKTKIAEEKILSSPLNIYLYKYVKLEDTVYLHKILPVFI